MARTVNRSLSRNYAPTHKPLDENKYYMYPLVTGGVLLMIGMLLYSTFMEIRIVPDYFADLSFIVPSFFFIPVAIMAKRGRIPKKHCRIVTTILLVLSIIALPLSAVTVILDTYTSPVVGAAYYEKTMQMLGHGTNTLLDSFPAEVPLNAEDATFYYITDSDEGTMCIELGFRTNEGMADPLVNGMESRAVWSGSLEELKASEYAGVVEHIYTLQPEGATYYIVQTTTDEATEMMDSAVLSAATDDGTMYYLYTLWTP